MHIPSVPGHTKLSTDAQSWYEALIREREALPEGSEAKAITSAIVFAGLSIAAAIERSGNAISSLNRS